MENLQLSLNLLKYADIREEVKRYFKEKYNMSYADGNNFGYIVDFLSILNMFMSYQLMNEMKNIYLNGDIRDRKIAVDLAQKLGYTPHRKIPSIVSGIIRLYGNNGSVGISNIKMKGRSKGLNYIVSDLTGTITNSSYVDIPFTAYQKESKVVYTTIDEDLNYITIENDKISNDPIRVYIDETGVDDYSTEWDNFDTFDNIPVSDSNVFFVKEDIDVGGKVYIQFGNGIIGKKPQSDDNIKIEYTITDGADGNGELEIEFDGGVGVAYTLSSASSAEIYSYSFSFGGKNEETIDEIKKNAPKFYCVKGRLVSKSDYYTILNNESLQNVKYFDIVDIYSDDNLEYFYKLGNIYLSIVPDSLYSIEDTYNNMLTTNKSLPFDAIETLIWSESDAEEIFSAYQNYFILSTNRVVIAPTYLYTDVYTNVELTNKNHDFTKIANDLMEDLYNYSQENLEGLNKELRVAKLMDILMEDTRIKSGYIKNLFSIIVNKQIIEDIQLLSFPSSIMTDNYKAYLLDKMYLGYNYSYNEMPYERRCLYSVLEPATTTLFNRYLISDNFLSSQTTDLATTVYFDYDTTNYTYQFQSDEKISWDGSVYEVVIKTATDISDYMSLNNQPPAYYKEDNFFGNSFYNFTTPSNTGNYYYIYLKTGSEYYLLGAILIDPAFEDQKYMVYYTDPNVSSVFFEANDIISVSNKTFLYKADTTYNTPEENDVYENIKIEIHLITNTVKELAKEFLKIRSRKQIAKIVIDAKNNTNIQSLDDIFTASTPTRTSEYEYINLEVDNSGTPKTVCTVKRTISTNKLEVSSTYTYPTTGYDTYKNDEFTIENNILYCYEIIDDTPIGYIDRTKNNIFFNSMLNVNGSVISLNKFIEDYSLLDSSKNYQINIRNAFTIKDDIVEYVNDFDPISGVCTIYNINKPVKYNGA